jgi:hypothetical protein
VAYPVSLKYYPARSEWGIEPFVLPTVATGGMWWISLLEVVYIDASRVVYEASSPYDPFTYRIYDQTGEEQRSGQAVNLHVGQDYVTEPGSIYYYIETFPNASSQGARTDTTIRIYEEGDFENWIAWNDDGGRVSLFAGLKIPLQAGKKYYICVEDLYGDEGFYSVMISNQGFTGTSSANVADPDSYEPDDDVQNATILVLEQVQNHSFSQYDQDWFLFKVPQ